VVFAGMVEGTTGNIDEVYVSRDAGLSWKVFGHGLASGQGIMSLVVAPPGALYAGTMGHAAWTASEKDPTWRQIANGMPITNDHVSGIAALPGPPRTLYAGTLSKGVFRSTDGGKRWTNVSHGLPALSDGQKLVLSLAYSPLQQVLYAGTVDGLYALAIPSQARRESSR
jgi:hypothetical protein